MQKQPLKRQFMLMAVIVALARAEVPQALAQRARYRRPGRQSATIALVPSRARTTAIWGSPRRGGLAHPALYRSRQRRGEG